jgi:hypothetical protein
VKQRFIEKGNAVLTRGVFGSPQIVFNGEIFWGGSISSRGRWRTPADSRTFRSPRSRSRQREFAGSHSFRIRESA